MSESRYLEEVLKMADAYDKYARRTLFKILMWAVAAFVGVVALPTRLGLLGSNEYFLMSGLIAGVLIMRLSSTYRFKYIVPHLNLQSIRSHLDQSGT